VIVIVRVAQINQTGVANVSISRGYKQMVADANARVLTRTVAEARSLHTDEHIVFVDLRDKSEIESSGKVPGAFHAPRGTLEFWVDPESPGFQPIFGDDSKHFVFYCAGGFRSALSVATLLDMGMTNVSQIEGGFDAWKNSGAPVETD
jgi:rhodanese-related sulfurtransferase